MGEGMLLECRSRCWSKNSVFKVMPAGKFTTPVCRTGILAGKICMVGDVEERIPIIMETGTANNTILLSLGDFNWLVKRKSDTRDR